MPRARGVAREVQRQRKLHAGKVARKPGDAAAHAHGGHGDAAGGERLAVGVLKVAQGAHGFGEVGERLAHPHEQHAEGREQVLVGEVVNLLEHLAGGEVALECERAGRAKLAAEGAPRLRAYAKRRAVPRGEVNGFKDCAVGRAEGVFNAAVAGLLALAYFGDADWRKLCELMAQLARQVEHLFVVKCAARMQP